MHTNYNLSTTPTSPQQNELRNVVNSGFSTGFNSGGFNSGQNNIQANVIGSNTNTFSPNRNNTMSKSNDPFYVAKEEIEGSFNLIQAMVSKIQNTPKNSPKISSMAQEVHAEIRQLECDTQDIGATIGIVEANPERFQVSGVELSSRKTYVANVEQRIQQLKATVRDVTNSANVNSFSPGAMRQAPSNFAASSSSFDPHHQEDNAAQEMNDYVGQARQGQKQLVQKQDAQLEELSKVTSRLNETALVINTELQEQQEMLSKLDEDIEKETEKMGIVMRRLGILMKTSDSRQLWLILILFGVFMLLLMLVMA